MDESLPKVELKKETWVDLYSVTGISVGTPLIIQNTGKGAAIVSESASVPTTSIGHNYLPIGGYVTNQSGAVGAWAKSGRGTTLQVEES